MKGAFISCTILATIISMATPTIVALPICSDGYVNDLGYDSQNEEDGSAVFVWIPAVPAENSNAPETALCEIAPPNNTCFLGEATISWDVADAQSQPATCSGTGSDRLFISRKFEHDEHSGAKEQWNFGGSGYCPEALSFAFFDGFGDNPFRNDHREGSSVVRSSFSNFPFGFTVCEFFIGADLWRDCWGCSSWSSVHSDTDPIADIPQRMLVLRVN